YRLVECPLCYGRDFVPTPEGWTCPECKDEEEPYDEKPWVNTISCSAHGVQSALWIGPKDWWCWECEGEAWDAAPAKGEFPSAATVALPLAAPESVTNDDQ